MATSFAGWQVPHRIPLQGAPCGAIAAGTSSFGMSGVNAHAIIRQAQQEGSAAPAVPRLCWQRVHMEAVALLHPLLGAAASLPKQGVLRLALALGTRPSLAFMWDHRVQGAAIMPGAAYCEAALAAGHVLRRGAASAVALAAAAIAAPLMLPPASEAATTLLAVEVAPSSGQISIRSIVAGTPGGRKKPSGVAETLHLHGALAAVSRASITAPTRLPGSLSADAARAACPEPQATPEVYNRLAGAGLQYGPAFRQLRGIRRGDVSAAARLHSTHMEADVTGFLLHPALLDNCLQLGAVVPEAGAAQQQATRVPAGIAVYALQQPVQQGAALLALARRSAASAQQAEGASYRDHTLLASCGTVLAVLDGLQAKPLAGAQKSNAAAGAPVREEANVTYELAWQAVDGQSVRQPPTDLAGTLVIGLGAAPTLGPLPLASSALVALQGALQAQASGVRLATLAAGGVVCSAAPPSHAASLSGSGAWGMLRAFGQEAPGISHGGAVVDPHALDAAVASVTLQTTLPQAFEADGYGVLVRNGVLHRALLMPSSRAHQAPEPFHLMPRPRGAFRWVGRWLVTPHKRIA